MNCKRGLSALLAGLLCAALLAGCSQQAAQTGTVTDAELGLNVRSGPGSDRPVIGGLDTGTCVVILGQEAGWYQVLYLNRAGQAAYYESTSPVAPKDSAKAYYPAYVRHADRANVVMFDGHAEPLSYQQLTEERAKYCNPCVKQWQDSNLAIREF